MMQTKKILIAALVSCSLAGCGTMSSNTSMYSVHQPVVERTNYAIDVNAGYGSGLDTGEYRRVSEWFDALKLGYGDRISIDYGAAGSNGALQSSVVQLAETYGLQLTDTAPVTAGEVAPGTARIVVTRSKASVPSCPDNSGGKESNFNAGVSSNYGCATNSNLAAMVADPEDLVRGQETAPMTGNGSNAAINKMRMKRAGGEK
jgi:pilus assembly protein CpaD